MNDPETVRRAGLNNHPSSQGHRYLPAEALKAFLRTQHDYTIEYMTVTRDRPEPDTKALARSVGVSKELLRRILKSETVACCTAERILLDSFSFVYPDAQYTCSHAPRTDMTRESFQPNANVQCRCSNPIPVCDDSEVRCLKCGLPL